TAAVLADQLPAGPAAGVVAGRAPGAAGHLHVGHHARRSHREVRRQPVARVRGRRGLVRTRPDRVRPSRPPPRLTRLLQSAGAGVGAPTSGRLASSAGGRTCRGSSAVPSNATTTTVAATRNARS